MNVKINLFTSKQTKIPSFQNNISRWALHYSNLIMRKQDKDTELRFMIQNNERMVVVRAQGGVLRLYRKMGRKKGVVKE